MIVRESRPLLLAAAIVAALVHAGVGLPLALLPWGLVLLLGWLFRDPLRRCSVGPLELVGPVDGTVAATGRAPDPYRVQDARHVVLDVGLPGPYLLRSPIEGQVVERWNGWHDPAGGARRAGRAICIRTDEGDEVLLAYRPRLPVPLRLRAAVGERVGHGQPLGLLPFGGRAAVLFSGHGRALVAPGDRVAAGVDPVAELLHD